MTAENAENADGRGRVAFVSVGADLRTPQDFRHKTTILANPKAKRSETVEMRGENDRGLSVQIEIRFGHQRNISAGFDERLQVGGYLRRRELVEPVLVARGLELPFFDCVIQDKTSDTIDQRGNDAHLGNNGCTSKRPDRRFAQNRKVFLERTIGSFGCRAQSVQLPVPFRSSRDFENETRMLSNRNVSGIAEPIGAMRTIPVKIDTGRKLGFHALLETSEGKSLSCRVKTIRSSRKPAIRNIRPAISIVASFNESFTNQLFIPGIVID